ncbi:hypothetical protein HZH66_013534 [Vespula vulgaris]|uniref:Uncharacterized protein n=1 Tax=Vespula vulgaris TaxID=7454 RepID=A0A834J5Z5_VESVU|nr:hypothetical protein HZH66_013534 [Vespula vulgaris]
MIKRREEKETKREKKNLEDDLNLVVRLRLKRGRSRIDGDKERKFIDSSGINRYFSNQGSDLGQETFFVAECYETRLKLQSFDPSTDRNFQWELPERYSDAH